jgi:uncharacterized protein YyaL (SSP411 family)
MYGRPGFKTLLQHVQRAWQEKGEALASDSEKVVESIRMLHGAGGAGETLSRQAVSDNAEQIWRGFDSAYGGIPSGSNKFPPSQAMDLLLREFRRGGYEPYRNAVELTLEKMGNGGIYDHLGGGIARYSTDPKWLVPHFEKMLYDQALVSSIYLDACQATERPEFRTFCVEKARGIFDYVLRDLCSPEGAFYSSEDADSEGLEGKFYIWTKEQVQDVLGEDAAKLFCSHYDVTEYGNWAHPGDEHVPHGPKNILQVDRPVEVIAKLEHLDPADVERSIAESRQKLFEARRKRVRPGLDDKILTGWNGLMITALAKGAAVLDDGRYGGAAAKAADFILREMRQEGRLFATYGKGRARLMAYVTDYAFLVEGLLYLYEWSADLRWLEEAERLTDKAIEFNWDEAGGGFFFTASDHEALIVRSKTAHDGAIPSGNSVMLMNLQRLSILLRQDLRRKAGQIIQVFGGGTARSPFQHERFLCGVEAWHDGFQEVAIVGAADDAATRALVRAVYDTYLPNKVVALGDPMRSEAGKQVPLLANRPMVHGKPTAYVCRNYTCQEPVNDPGHLLRQLERTARATADR